MFLHRFSSSDYAELTEHSCFTDYARNLNGFGLTAIPANIASPPGVPIKSPARRPRQERKLVSRSHKVSRQASRRICNPALKNVLTYLGSADLKSAAKENAFPFVGGLQIPRFNRSNLFLRRISNPPGRLAGDFTVTPSGRLYGDAWRETLW